MSKLNLNPMADWGYVNNSRFRFLSIRNQGGGVKPVPPHDNNKILYTSLTFYDAEGLYEMIQSIPTITIAGPRLMSNEWENGNGVLTFDGDITTIGFEGDISTAATIYSWVFLNYVELGITNDITSVTLPKSVTSIGDSAFQRCITLTSVNIPNSVTVIGNYAFKGCGGLTSVIIPDTVTEICSGAFSSCSALTSVIIPDSVERIGSYAFYNCSALTSVIIGNSVAEIMRNAFEGCGGLISIIIPDSVERIGSYAFYGCSNLTEVTCLVTKPPILGTYNFTTSNGILYVPADSVQAYLHDTNWNTAFSGNIQAIQE